jgi:sodium pump decarboxylase gamma subunit
MIPLESTAGWTNIPWGLEITGVGMGMVFLMLLILMGFLMLMTSLDRPSKESDNVPLFKKKQKVEPVVAAASAAAATKSTLSPDQELAAAIAVALHATPGVADGDLSATELAALAVAIHQIQSQDGVPSLAPGQSGMGLANSRWVTLGRSLQNTRFHRS